MHEWRRLRKRISADAPIAAVVLVPHARRTLAGFNPHAVAPAVMQDTNRVEHHAFTRWVLAVNNDDGHRPERPGRGHASRPGGLGLQPIVVAAPLPPDPAAVRAGGWTTRPEIVVRLSGSCVILYGCPHEGSHRRCDSTRKGTDVEDDNQEELDRVRSWVDRLEKFAWALGDIDGDSATDFANNALEALQAVVMPHIVASRTPAMLLALEAVVAVTQATTDVIVDWADTPDVRDRYSRATAHAHLKAALDDVLSGSKRWLTEGLPATDEVEQRIAGAAKQMQEAMELLGKLNAELEAQDAEAATDPYGAILIHLDPSRSDAPIFEKVCSLTEDDHKRYRDAYERLRKMLDSELLGHISDESDRFLDQLVSILKDLQDNRIGIFDEDAWDEHRRQVRSAMISFTSALQSHEDQTLRAVRETFARKTPQEQAVLALFTDLKATSFEYRWLLKMRDALLHGDINAFKYDFAARLKGEKAVNVYMDRRYMFEFTKEERGKPWLKRDELENMTSDPSVLDMIKKLQPLMGPLQEKLDRVLYPDAGVDAATIREFLARYPEGAEGYRALQNGPGFTRRNMCPPLSPLAPRVLAFADGFQGWED